MFAADCGRMAEAKLIHVDTYSSVRHWDSKCGQDEGHAGGGGGGGGGVGVGVGMEI